MDSIVAWIAAILAFNVILSADKITLKAKIAAIQATIESKGGGASVSEKEKIEYKGRRYTLEELEDFSYGIEEAELILEFGSPDVLESRFQYIRTAKLQN